MAQRFLPGRRGLRVVAILLVLNGIAVLIGSGALWWHRVRQVQAAQQALRQVPVAQWSETVAGGSPVASGSPVVEGPPIAKGSPLAVLDLPTIGVSLVVVEGDDGSALAKGPGHVVGTPLFGQGGNVGVAGHRYPGIFWDLDRLAQGDPVVVSTTSHWYVYRVSAGSVVGANRTSVLNPPDAEQPEMLTLITCDPKLTTARRLIRQAVLVRIDPVGQGQPSELGTNQRQAGLVAQIS